MSDDPQDRTVTPAPGLRPPAPGSVDFWIEAARDGSPAAWGQALEASRRYLLKVADRSLATDLQAKVGLSDVVQETFVRAQASLEDFRGKTEQELFAWLTKILANHLIDNARHYDTEKRRVDREISADSLASAIAQLSDADATPSAVVMAREEEGRVQAALAQLEPDCREILIMRTWNRMPFEDIGAARNCSAEAARKQWSRAVQELERHLRQV